jgi:hypothetical protein
MSVEDLLDRLTTAGLSVAWSNGALVLRGPAAARTPEVMAALKRFRAELADLYRPPPLRCPGFTAKGDKGKLVRVECGALFWVEADCAEACINRFCPQQGGGSS